MANLEKLAQFLKGLATQRRKTSKAGIEKNAG
jgi:hypothetical protein